MRLSRLLRFLLLFPVLASTVPVVQAEKTKKDFGTIFVSKYYLNNNVWGKKNSPGYTSSIWNVNESSPLSWGAKYSFPEGGKPYEVKAFLSVISGWHWGTNSRGSGLPVQLTEKRPVMSSGSFEIKNPGVQNMAFDLWFHELKQPTEKDNPTDELMIWLASYQGAGPLGKKEGTVKIAGAEWDLYKGNVGWEVFSFVRKGNATEWSLNLDDFIQHIVQERKWMSEKKHLTSVQFGTEVFRTQGESQMNVKDYRVDVSLPKPHLVPVGWFEWPLMEPVDGSALDASPMNHKPAGSLGRIGVKDENFVTGDGKPLRFWGCNLTAHDAFMDAPVAADFARLLAKNGVNIARLHHIDNPWGKKDGGSLWPAGDKHETLDDGQLDKIHRLVAELKRNGIYTNLNLKVSKTLTPSDGFPASVAQVPDFQKRVDMFQRRMIDLQKDYARRILTPKNPYTGLSLAEDPAVAVLEMNNENSILGFWTRDLGRGLHLIAEPFRTDLAQLWNRWLKAKYHDDTSLSTAWAQPASGAGESILDPKRSWRPDAKQGTHLELKSGEDKSSLELQIIGTTGVDWHVQAHRDGLSLKDSEVYSVEFEVKADCARKIQAGVGIDTLTQPEDSWRSFGLLDQVDVSTEWKRVTLAFCAHSVSGAPGRLSFNVGQRDGMVWIKNLKVRVGCDGSGVQPGESLSKGNVAIPVKAGSAQWADWIRFLADTERSFAMEMRDFLRNELKVQAPMVCTQIDYGGLTGMWREQDMEFADSHTYWQHPDFPGAGMWDKDAWTIRNSPQVEELRDRSFGELGYLAQIRVAGKPFALSEYDHAAPSEYACEMYALLSSFASRQDWNALYPFCVGSTGASDETGAISGYFDQQHHPAKWGFSVFATTLFRQGLVRPAGLKAELKLGDPFWGESHHSDVLWRKLIPKGPLGFLSSRLGVGRTPLPVGQHARLERSGDPDLSPLAIIQTGKGSVWIISAERVAAAVGTIGGAKVRAGALCVETAEFGKNFAAVTAVALDAKPLPEARRILITLAARAENQGMIWNEKHNSVGSRWGMGPPIAEQVPATVAIEGFPGLVVYALSPDGTRSRKVASTHANGSLSFKVSPEDKTLHYELIAE